MMVVRPSLQNHSFEFRGMCISSWHVYCVQSVQTSTIRRSVTQCSVLVTQAGCWPTVHEPVSHAIKPSGQLSHVLLVR